MDLSVIDACLATGVMSATLPAHAMAMVTAIDLQGSAAALTTTQTVTGRGRLAIDAAVVSPATVVLCVTWNRVA